VESIIVAHRSDCRLYANLRAYRQHEYTERCDGARTDSVNTLHPAHPQVVSAVINSQQSTESLRIHANPGHFLLSAVVDTTQASKSA